MAKSSKRSAEEAFEEVQQPDQSADKKRKKRKKNRKNRAENAEAKDSLERAHSTNDVLQEDEQEGGTQREVVQPQPEPEVAEHHGGISKRKRKREWKEKHGQPAPSSPTTPKREVKEATEPVKQQERQELVSLTSNADESAKKKKKRRRKKGKGEQPQATVEVPHVNDVEGEDAPEASGTHLQDEPTRTATMGDHNVESPKEVRRRKKRERKALQSQLSSQLGAGVDDSIQVEDESLLNQAEAEEPVEEPQDQVEEHVDEPQDCEKEPAVDLGDTPLDHETETPKKSRKRKRRSHGARKNLAVNQAEPDADEDGDATAMQVDQDSPEVTSAPLEDRIKSPDEVKSRQDETVQDGDASSADGLHGAVNVELDDTNPLALALALPDKKHTHKTDHPGERQRKTSWSMSEGTAGVFIDQDPILTSDDQHLILPTRSEVRIYSRPTSLLVRSLKNEQAGHIVCCVLSNSDPSLCLVGTSRGIVSLWDWTHATLLDAWSTDDDLRQIIPITHEGSLSILAVHKSAEGYTLRVFHLGTGIDEASEGATLQSQKHFGHVRLFQNAGVIVTSARSRILTGHCRNLDITEIGEDTFTWHTLKLPSAVASFDAQVGPSVGKRKLARIDLAVGLASGDILTYEDILFKVRGKEKDPSSEVIEPRTLSWHRNLVNAIKWSRDGNYIISGGSEHTLVSWQLDTNQRQYLPHLSTPILNLTVSHKGSAYALRLADNSVMVLGTADMVPETSISGLAASTTGRLVSSLHPSSVERLLIACPADTLLPLKNEDHNTSLQTYDLSADMQLGRQALTRNLTTVVNVDPEGRLLSEPNVSHLQISADGKWLATIDEWQPPAHDSAASHLLDETEARKENSEIRLRIWSYNDDQNDWALVTRVDDPNNVARILSLQSSPARSEFAAIGADGIIRIWQPRARSRDGVHVRDSQGKQLFTWTSIHAVNVPMHGKDEATSAALAYSDDGSVLAVSVELAKKGLQWTYLIDSRTGELVHSVPDLVTGGERCLAFTGRNLVLLSKTICVYDTVSSQVISRTEFSKDFCTPDSTRFLAVNRLDNTVAIGLNRGGKHGGRLAVLDVNKLDEGGLLEEKIPGQVRAILASPSTSGFVVIDGYNQIRQVKPLGQTKALIPAAAVESEEVAKGLNRVFGKKQVVNGETNGTGTASKLLPTDGNEGVTGRTLEEALGFETSAAAPGVDDLFDRIAGVFARPAAAA